jgi:hypothetical protein
MAVFINFDCDKGFTLGRMSPVSLDLAEADGVNRFVYEESCMKSALFAELVSAAV